jgi:arylsulfatase A-like enzyme/Tfp pilus assembly protein PilF
MKKRHLYTIILLMALPGSSIASASLSSWTAGKKIKQNVILITIDTLRADKLGCYGSTQVKTPIIDSLASRGVLFSKAFALTPATLPSHTNIFLGTSPLYHGVHDNFNAIVDEGFLTLAEYLKSFGYSTGAFIGAFPLDSRFGLAQGFDVYDDGYQRVSTHKYAYGERPAEEVVDKALVWLEKQDSPWFLWLHCFDPHDPYDPPPPFAAIYKNHPYEGEVAYVDSALEKLFLYMEEHDLFEKTLLIFTADHGESLRQHGEIYHGYLAYNSTLRIPLILSFPGQAPTQIDQCVSHLDIFPTVCDILDIKKPAFLQGTSLLPALKGKKLPQRIIYFESLFPYLNRGWAPIQGFIEGKEKFIDSPIPELYNLDKDIDETENLAGQIDLGRYRNRLKKVIEEKSLPLEPEKTRHVDRESLRILSSLGYISSPIQPTKKVFGPEDDVKVLLPHCNRAEDAMDLYKKGNADEAVRILQDVIEEEKKIDLAYAYLAEIYQKTGKPDEALEVLKKGLEHHPSSFIIITNYTHYLLSSERYDDAIQVIEQNVIPRMDFDPEIWNCLGLAYWKTGHDRDAIDAFEKAVSLDDEYANVFNNLGAVYLSLFIRKNEQLSFSQAIQYYNKALELDPRHVPAYIGLGHAYRKAGNLERAIYFWEKAVKLETKFSETVYNLSQAYQDFGDNKKALSLLLNTKEKFYPQLNTTEKRKLDAFIKQIQ